MRKEEADWLLSNAMKSRSLKGQDAPVDLCFIHFKLINTEEWPKLRRRFKPTVHLQKKQVLSLLWFG